MQSIPGTTIGSVIGSRPNISNPGLLPVNLPKKPQAITPKSRPKEMDMIRGVNYYADFSGCGFWRMVWPEHTLNSYSKAIVHGSTVMVSDEKYYTNVKCVRIQRQATPDQLEFVKFLKKLGDKMGFSVVYEIDDIVFYEDIPEYNKFRGAFADPIIKNSITEMMQICDEITVTCDYMKKYYIDKTGNDKVTVIPNYPPKYWIGNHYDDAVIERNYNKRKKKPRVLYAGSGAHFDVDNRIGQKDDFQHVVETIKKTVNKYQWIFIGAFPMGLRSLVRAGKIEFHPWTALYDYPALMQKIKANIMVAPLTDNVFNRAKSDLKYIEGAALGIPTICQDMCTYADAPYKFNTGAEMIDQIDSLMKDKDAYMKASRKARMVAETRWLENPDNINKYTELYTLPYGHPDRKLLKP